MQLDSEIHAIRSKTENHEPQREEEEGEQEEEEEQQEEPRIVRFPSAPDDSYVPTRCELPKIPPCGKSLPTARVTPYRQAPSD